MLIIVGDWIVDGKLSFSNKMMETVELTFLPQSKTICLVTGGLDFVIHVFVRRSQDQYTKICVLSGHQDWLRALSFVTCDDGTVLLASASQDAKVRLWRFIKRVHEDEQTKQVMDLDISAL